MFVDGNTPFPVQDYRLVFSLSPLRSLRLCGLKKGSSIVIEAKSYLYSSSGKGVVI
jgi:hypothetical protein